MPKRRSRRRGGLEDQKKVEEEECKGEAKAGSKARLRHDGQERKK